MTTSRPSLGQRVALRRGLALTPAMRQSMKLLELSKRTKTGKIKTFYDELSISNPDQYDLDALKIVASRTIVARKKELWRRQDSETDQMDDRLLVLTLVSDMLTTELPRQVYENVFMQGLTGYWGWADRRAFLRDICMWIEDGK